MSSIRRYPQKAGKMCPAASRKSGSRAAGNMIPESRMEGRNKSWETMVSFAWLFTARPRTHPRLKDAAVYIARARKKRGRCAGKAAPNRTGERTRMRRQLIIRWINAERNHALLLEARRFFEAPESHHLSG